MRFNVCDTQNVATSTFYDFNIDTSLLFYSFLILLKNALLKITSLPLCTSFIASQAKEKSILKWFFLIRVKRAKRMCILFLYVNPEPEPGEYRMVIAHNRDEYYKRPASRAIKDNNNIIGGRDLEEGKEGGMWLGLKATNDGKYKFSTLLNLGGSRVEKPHSGRGFIVPNYLLTSKSFHEYVKDELETGNRYDGYNFVAVDLDTQGVKVNHHCNLPKFDTVYHGKHTLVFSNSPSFSPLQKALMGRYKFEDILKNHLTRDDLVKELLELLRDDEKYLPDEELKRRVPSMWEKLASVFIEVKGKEYGTRTHTIILIDCDWKAQFVEYTMAIPGEEEFSKWIHTNLTLFL